MSCPNCGERMKKVEFDNQFILHCHNCGGSFFEQNGINRISLKSARQLAWDKKKSFTNGTSLACPLDSSMMIVIQNDAVPVDVNLLRCPSCYGLFANPEELVKFKRAQNVKIRFFKVWSKPLPSLQTVLVTGFLGLMIFSLAMSMVSINSKRLSTTSAQDQISNVYAKKTDTFLFISFRTSQPYRASIRLIDKTTEESVVKQVSDNFNTLHTVTVTGVNAQDTIYYQILLEDKHGDKLVTAESKLPIQ